MSNETSNWKMFVGGLGPDVNDTSLREAFSVHGEVTEAKVVTDRKTGMSRGFGFVTFTDYYSAWDSMNIMDQWDLYGRTATVRFAEDVDIDDTDDDDFASDDAAATALVEGKLQGQ
ncbi:hypothetical protein QVD17_29431 [Tagetes erecta]|uniref:RRM domain-containing protein n=1 Tax=Tagetes erecta TaxID=13708 RepID=A0AAD8KF59_TARER|nr:hypothetical protein QVD17_29431 [Tagetes erecta]